MKSKKNTHGGQRANAGRKPSGIKTKVLTFRVPESKVEVVKDAVRGLLKPSEKNTPK